MQGAAAPGRQIGLAVAARAVGGIKVIPLALGIATPPIGRIATAAVGLSVEGSQRLTGFGQLHEHAFPAGDVSLALVRRHRVDPEGKERMAFRRHQIPLSVTLFGTEETIGLKRLTGLPAAKTVLNWTLLEPALHLLLLTGNLALELGIAGDLAWPVTSSGLPVAVDQAGIDSGQRRLRLTAKTPQQEALRSLRLLH